MKHRTFLVSSIVSLALAIGVPALASSTSTPSPTTPANFGGSGSGFTNDYGSHYVNNNNPNLRMDWTNQNFAVPGKQAGQNSSSSTVVAWGNSSLVVPPTGSTPPASGN